MTKVSDTPVPINRRSFLKSSVASTAFVPAAAVSACATPATAAIAPIYSEWLSLDAAYQLLWDQFDFWGMFELLPAKDEHDALMAAIDETPANTFEEIAVKVLLGTIEGGGAYRDETLNSARTDALRLLEARGLVPAPRPVSEAEIERLREGQRLEEAGHGERDKEPARLGAEQAESELRNRPIFKAMAEHGPQQVGEWMREFLAQKSA